MPTPAKHLLLNDEPGDTGSTPAAAPAPEVDNSLPSSAPAEAPAPAPAADEPPADPFAGLTKALESVGKADAPAPAPTPAPAPAEQKAETTPPAAPKAPEMDLTPPEGITDRSKERWNQLAERAKQVPQLEQQYREATTQLESVRALVTQSGLDANEFADMLEMARLFKAGDAKALQQLDGLRQDLATRLGVEAPGVDPLAAHPDLKADIEAMNLTKERALEIAKLRGKGQQHDARTQEQREVQEFQRTVQAAASEMEAVFKSKEGTPGHDQRLRAIHAYLQQPGKLQEFVTTYTPQQWKAQLSFMYDNIAVAAPAPTPAVPQPLRPTATRAGAPVRSGPVTAESAVGAAFDRLGL